MNRRLLFENSLSSQTGENTRKLKESFGKHSHGKYVFVQSTASFYCDSKSKDAFEGRPDNCNATMSALTRYLWFDMQISPRLKDGVPLSLYIWLRPYGKHILLRNARGAASQAQRTYIMAWAHIGEHNYCFSSHRAAPVLAHANELTKCLLIQRTCS